MSPNPIYLLFATTSSVGPFFLRIVVALLLGYHGLQKAFGLFGGAGWDATIADWTSSDGGFSVAASAAAAAIIGELAIALSMLCGFLVRLSAVGLIILMFGAIILVHWREGFAGMQYPLTLASIGLSLMAMGAGSFSLDRALSRNLLPTIG